MLLWKLCIGGIDLKTVIKEYETTLHCVRLVGDLIAGFLIPQVQSSGILIWTATQNEWK